MRIPAGHILAILVAGLLTLFTAGAQPWHVDAAHASASDANPGTPDLPLLTLARGVELAMPGDTVFIKGIYHEVLYTERDGTPSQPIVFAAAPGADAVIDGSVGEPGENGVISSHSWIRFEGLEIRNWNGNAMWFEGGGNLLLRDCEVHEATFGIGMTDGCHDFTLERVRIHHFDLYGFDASPSPAGSCRNGTFIDCDSHTGRDPEQNVDGFALGHGEQYGFVFRNCRTWGVYDGFDISSRETTLDACAAFDCINGGYKLWQDEILLRNCLAYHNGNANVELDWDGTPGSVTMWNCSFHDAGVFNVWVENSADTLFLYNCILSGGDLNGLAFELQDTRAYFGDGNLFQNDDASRMINVGYEVQYGPDDLGAWRAATGQDANSLSLSSADGIYIDAAAFDLHLAASSPARDKGISAGAPPEDCDGNPRPDGTQVDIGAYEYQSGTRIEEFPEEFALTLEAYPNPGRSGVRLQIESEGPRQAALAVYDAAGRDVLRRAIMLHAGMTTIEWDGTDRNGKRMKGVFILRLRTAIAEKSIRIVLL